jgi:hypothetical protein
MLNVAGGKAGPEETPNRSAQMRSLKIGVVAVFAMAGLVALIPASALAAPHAVVTFGTVAPTPSINSHGVGSFVVNTPTGKVVKVYVNKNTKFIPNAAGFAANDAVWASGGVGKHQYASTVKYALAPFAIPYAKRTFNGKYDATLSTTPSTSIVIDAKGGKHLSFAITASTKYRLNGKLWKSATQPGFTAGERMTVYGQELTNGKWQAQRVGLFTK